MDTIQGMGAAQALYSKRGWKGHEVSESANESFTLIRYSRDFKWLGPCTNTFNRFNDYLEFFKENGYVIIPNILSLSQIEKALCDFDTTLLHYGVDVKNDLKRTAFNARELSSTHGAGGILDLFYPKWKIDLSLNNPFYCAAYQCLFQGTYGRHRSSRSQLWSHPYEIIENRPLAHIDRIGCRFPDSIVDSGDTRRSFQRGLAPHMDCCPKDIYGGGNKEFPRWRPIQCLLSLTSTTEKNEGGFECVPGFHHEFTEYYENRLGKKQINESDIVCVGDFTPMRDPDVLSRFKHIPIPAGAALFWDQRLPHANSLRNKSDKIRRCIYGGFLPCVKQNMKYNNEQRRRFNALLPQVDFWIDGQNAVQEKYPAGWEDLNGLGRTLLRKDTRNIL